MKDIIPIGTPTVFGKIAGVLYLGERYYFCEKLGVVSLMPENVLLNLDKFNPTGEVEHV